MLTTLNQMICYHRSHLGINGKIKPPDEFSGGTMKQVFNQLRNKKANHSRPCPSLVAPPINHQTTIDRNAQMTPLGIVSLTMADIPQTTNQPNPRHHSPYIIIRLIPTPSLLISLKYGIKIPHPLGFNINNEKFTFLLQFIAKYYANK